MEENPRSRSHAPLPPLIDQKGHTHSGRPIHTRNQLQTRYGMEERFAFHFPEEEIDSSQPAELQDQVVVPEVIKKPRIPPFFVSPKGDWRQLVALAKLIAPSFQSQMSGRFLKVTVGDELEYRNLSHWLEQTGVEFKSFMLKQDRPIKVVIRGLPSNTEPEDIKSEIEAEGFKVAKISQMKNYRTKAPMPLFYLQIENGVDALKIYDFTELFGTRIEVKPFERGNKVNQCWRCQGWFHSSEVCHLPPRCVKCAGPHSAKDCTLDFNDPMKCANCSGAHAANWSRCPKHPNNAKKKIKIKMAQISRKMFHLKTTPQAPRPDISKARKVSPNLDYSKVVQNLIPREHLATLGERNWSPRRLPHTSNRTSGSEVLSTWLCSSTSPTTIVSEFLAISALITNPKKPLPSTDLTSNENIELAISELNQNFSEAFVEASKPKFKNVPKILSPEIKSKIHQRNRLRKFWQRSRCPSIYSEFRTLSREIAKDIKSHSQAQWEKHIEALSPEDNTLWRKSSLLRKPFRSIPPLKGALGSTAITPIEKAEVIADSLQEQFEPNHVADREVFDQRIHEEVANFLATPHVQEIEPTTPTEVLTYVQRIKPKKSPGLDQISNRMLKNLPLKFLLFITLLINQLFKNNYFPDSWKTAVVIPILKPDKNPELAQNYRPISLLSCLSKVYEFVLLQRLNQHCAAANFIIPQQCGFRPKCSTVHQLLRVTELIHSGFAKHEATGILFLDIAKAFDKIWHDGLLIKLIRLDFPAPLIKSIHSFLSHRSFRVRVDRILSSPRPIRSGLPQGSLSSPKLPCGRP
ncbi:probable RNA-directed DNA polymerase from transposon X-element [Trichonephila clavipes]|nr:probable RNA-directed DNA polymerase from transposon X-element [Trichonephila clavipes]